MAETLKNRMKRLEEFLGEAENGLKKSWPVVDRFGSGVAKPYQERIDNINTARRVIDWLKGQQQEIDANIVKGR